MTSTPPLDRELRRVVRFATLDALAPLAGDWDRLSRGVPFRHWDWMSAWWRHYGTAIEERGSGGLYVLGVFDAAERLLGLAPWYVESTRPWGRRLRFLGTGEVCSEYLAVLCAPDREDEVAQALAHWLHAANQGAGARSDRWDLLEMAGVDAEEPSVARLAEALRARGSLVHRRPGSPCWRLALPSTWNEYVASLPGNHRGQLQRLGRRFLDQGRAVVHWADTPEELQQAQQLLIDLHQSRHADLGRPGAFASPRFTAFHREAISRLALRGRIRLVWIEIDGTPVAVDYLLVGPDTVYYYQSGIVIGELCKSPGWLMHRVALQWAIDRGCSGFDFLRGDEPYKARWGATPRATTEIRVTAHRLSAKLRHGAWRACSKTKRTVKATLSPVVALLC